MRIYGHKILKSFKFFKKMVCRKNTDNSSKLWGQLRRNIIEATLKIGEIRKEIRAKENCEDNRIE